MVFSARLVVVRDLVFVLEDGFTVVNATSVGWADGAARRDAPRVVTGMMKEYGGTDPRDQRKG